MHEQRQHQRHDIPLQVEFHYFSGDPDRIGDENPAPARGFGTIIDISIGGMSMLSESPVPPGLPISLFFTMLNESGDSARRVLLIANGTVVRSEPQPAAHDGTVTTDEHCRLVAIRFAETQHEIASLFADRR